MTDRLTYTGTLVVTICWCGIGHAIPESLYEEANKTGTATFCPLGHSGVYKGSENERLRNENARLRTQMTHERDQREASERSNVALRAANTRQRRRAAAGVCRFCHRHFENVERHVNTKHPNEAKRGD